MIDFRLSGLRSQKRPHLDAPILSDFHIINHQIRNVADKFLYNTKRLIAAELFPQFCWALSGMKQHANAVALQMITNSLLQLDKNDERYEEFVELAYQTYDAIRMEFLKDPIGANEILDNTLDFIQQEFDMPSTTHFITSWLESMIVTSWTAFEVMAGDLWESALNIHPQILAELNGKWEKEDKSAPNYAKPESPIAEDAPSKTRSEKKLKLYYLGQHNYDVSKKMGTIWRQDDRFNFQVLPSIRQAYEVAFRIDYKEISASIYNENITALSALRNIIVHKACVVDEEFLVQSKGISILSSAVLGKQFLISGDIARSVTSGAMRASSDLIMYVDKWINEHK